MKRFIGLLAACLCLLVLAGCGKSAVVKETEKLIDAIGTVTVDSALAIETAESAYGALSQEDKARISNYEVLTAARQTLDEMKLEALRQALLGTWRTKIDIKDVLGAEIDAQFSDAQIHFADYMERSDLSLILELKEDGAYHMEPDMAEMTVSLQSFREAMSPFIRAFFRQTIAKTLQSSGIEGDFSTLEGLEAAIGTDLDAAIEASMGVKLEDYVDMLMDEMDVESLFAGAKQEGWYRVEPEGLYLFDEVDQKLEENHALAFTLSADTLTLKIDLGHAVLGLTELVFQRGN